jgi:hypothetical protein
MKFPCPIKLYTEYLDVRLLRKAVGQTIFSAVLVKIRSRDSVVGIATGYGLDGRGFRVRDPVGSRILSSSRRPDRLCGPPNLISNGYRGLFPRG